MIYNSNKDGRKKKYIAQNKNNILSTNKIKKQNGPFA